MGHNIKKILTDNLGLKVIALVLAVLIWWFVMNQNDPIRSMVLSNVPITIINEDSVADIGKVVEPEGSGMVTVKVTERRSILNRLARNGSNFYVEADLENLNEMNTVPLTVTCDNPSVTWDEIAINPSSLKVSLEDKVEQQFALNVTSMGEVATGYSVGTTEVLEGKTILIAGPSSLVNIINQVTAPIQVSGLANDNMLTAAVRVYDKNGAELTESQMSRLELKDSNGDLLTDHTVSVFVDLWQVKPDVAIKVETYGTPKNGYRIGKITTVPETITLTGSDETLELLGKELTVFDLVSVDGASEPVIREIDIADTISQYTDLRLVGDGDSVVSVTVPIEKSGDVSVDVPLADIVMENRPSDMKLVFTPADKVSVWVHASDVEAAPIRAEQIGAVMDLQECREEGTYEIPVDITLPEGYELSSGVAVKVIAAPLQTEEVVTE